MKLLLVLAIIVTAWWYLRRPRVPVLSTAEARALLEVPANASRAEITAAHRRLIARVHPDAGGSAILAQRVNAARDVLLAQP